MPSTKIRLVGSSCATAFLLADFCLHVCLHVHVYTRVGVQARKIGLDGKFVQKFVGLSPCWLANVNTTTEAGPGYNGVVQEVRVSVSCKIMHSTLLVLACVCTYIQVHFCKCILLTCFANRYQVFLVDASLTVRSQSFSWKTVTLNATR